MQSDEKTLTLAEAARLYPRRTHASTVWRHCRVGIMCRNGQCQHLEHIRCGGTILTSAEALGRFFSAIAKADLEYFNAPRPRGTRAANPKKCSRQKGGKGVEPVEQVMARIRADRS
jgi:hypothetical protein